VNARATQRLTDRRAFTLLEVMIAMAVFFVVVFAVLNVVVQSLGTARAWQQTRPDAGMLASQLSLTNQLEEGFESGDFGILFPGGDNPFPDQTWDREITEAGSNGLYRVHFVVVNRNAKGKQVSEELEIFMFRPGGNQMRRGRP
jgi:prepilin-type N-terminal cleavage/methylation domain-containing protein